METLVVIKAMAGKQFGANPDSIDVDVPIDQLGADSLGFLEFLFELEDRFAISIPQESVANVRTLRALAEVIDGLLVTATPPTSS